jgi:hypothetical protein
METRAPAVAGLFYPESREACRAEADRMIQRGASQAREGVRVIGGIVPHAGWICSGAVAGEVIGALTRSAGRIDTVVIFGAVHRRSPDPAIVDTRNSWHTPLGDILIDQELADAVVGLSDLVTAGGGPHGAEHSIEVEVPLVQQACPNARLLPVMVMPTARAPEIGHAVAACVRSLGRRAVFLGSTDLTHYGPSYGFVPKGAGADGLRWAKEENDRRFIDCVLRMDAEGALREAAQHHNACGSGAVAATIEACRALGADRAELLRHTTSSEVLGTRYGRMDDAVGYAGMVFVIG